MLSGRVLEKWHNNEPVINGWLSIPNSFTAQAMSKMGWDSMTIDLQHGQNDYSTSISMSQIIINSGITSFARVPWNEPGIIMKMLDLGIIGIIAPMINKKEDCEKFISYCRYPPLGQRSFGPMGALAHHGPEYFKNANINVICLAMIETKEAVDNLDEILSVPNLNGVYVGPADMCSSYGLIPKFDVKEDPIYSNIKLIVEKANKHKKIAGIHNGTTEYAKEMIDLGFKFLTISSDFRSMTAHAQGIIDQMKNFKQKKENSTY